MRRTTVFSHDWWLATGVAALLCTAALAKLPAAGLGLDEFSLPKELILCAGALVIGVVTLPHIQWRYVDWPIALILAAALLSALGAEDAWSSRRALSVWLSGAALLWCARDLSERGQETMIIIGVAAATVLAALIALLEAYGIVERMSMIGRAPGGTFGNRNYLAHFLVIGLPVQMLLRDQVRRHRRWLSNAGVTLTAVALTLSRSRGAWLALAASLLVLATLSGTSPTRLSGCRLRSALRNQLTFIGLGITLAVVLPNALQWRSATPYRETLAHLIEHDTGTGHVRLVQYRTNLDIIGAYPLLGVGPGNWRIAYPRFARRGDPNVRPDEIQPTNRLPLSDLVGLITEAGVLAGVGAACLVLGLVLSAVRQIQMATNRQAQIRATALILLLTAASVAGLFDPVLLQPMPLFLFAASAGALSAGMTSQPKKGGRQSVYLTLAWLIILGLSVDCASRQLLAASLLGYGEAPRDWERARAVSPGDYRINIALSQYWIEHGDCGSAMSTISAAAVSYPTALEPRRLAYQCRTVARQ